MTQTGTSEAGRFTVLSTNHPLLEPHLPAVQRDIDAAVADGRIRIVLDLGQVPFIDSSGLELLLATARRLRTAGGRLRLLNPNPLCSEILAATRLDGEIEVFFDLHQAGRSVR
jgi:anti-sigma B factor antagonist